LSTNTKNYFKIVKKFFSKKFCFTFTPNLFTNQKQTKMEIKPKFKKNYAYPVGDFLSGFSEDENNPCDYELECQRMVIRGVQYLDDNQKLVDLVRNLKVGVWEEPIKPLIEYMCLHEDNPEESMGHTGAMVQHCVKIAFVAQRMGWQEYIKAITTTEEQ
jgi:hypothetical protein